MFMLKSGETSTKFSVPFRALVGEAAYSTKIKMVKLPFQMIMASFLQIGEMT